METGAERSYERNRPDERQQDGSGQWSRTTRHGPGPMDHPAQALLPVRRQIRTASRQKYAQL